MRHPLSRAELADVVGSAFGPEAGLRRSGSWPRARITPPTR